MADAYQIGEFVLESKLGEGGMGIVFRAHQTALDRYVALKLLSRPATKGSRFVERFKREARAAAKLIHPNIIQIYTIGDHKGTPYFAMEYIEGKDLSQILEEGDVFSPDEAVYIVRSVAKALVLAFEANIVHRDLKPANIMITQRGEVKVMDFGLAKAASSGQSLTQEGQIVGTPTYMSPEQGMSKEVDVRSDLYALGCVLFETLTGRPPFDADNIPSLIYKHLYEDVPSLREEVPEINEALEAVCYKLLAKTPEERYQTPAELLEALVDVPCNAARAELNLTRRAAKLQDRVEAATEAEIQKAIETPADSNASLTPAPSDSDTQAPADSGTPGAVDSDGVGGSTSSVPAVKQDSGRQSGRGVGSSRRRTLAFTQPNTLVDTPAPDVTPAPDGSGSRVPAAGFAKPPAKPAESGAHPVPPASPRDSGTTMIPKRSTSSKRPSLPGTPFGSLPRKPTGSSATLPISAADAPPPPPPPPPPPAGSSTRTRMAFEDDPPTVDLPPARGDENLSFGGKGAEPATTASGRFNRSAPPAPFDGIDDQSVRRVLTYFKKRADGRWTYDVTLGHCEYAEGLAAEPLPGRNQQVGELGDCLACDNWGARTGCAIAAVLQLAKISRKAGIELKEEQAGIWCSAGRHDRAVDLIEEHIHAHPNDPAAYRALARVIERHDYPDADKRRAIVLYARFADLARTKGGFSPLEIKLAEERMAKLQSGVHLGIDDSNPAASTTVYYAAHLSHDALHNFRCFYKHGPMVYFGVGMMSREQVVIAQVGEVDPESGMLASDLGDTIRRATSIFRAIKSEKSKTEEREAVKANIARLQSTPMGNLVKESTQAVVLNMKEIERSNYRVDPAKDNRVLDLRVKGRVHELVFPPHSALEAERAAVLVKRLVGK